MTKPIEATPLLSIRLTHARYCFSIFAICNIFGLIRKEINTTYNHQSIKIKTSKDTKLILSGGLTNSDDRDFFQ